MRSFVPSEGCSEVSGIPVLPGLCTVLVNGGAGFLGSHLCERLLQRGDSVICLDNFSTGRRTNVDHLVPNARFQIIEHDVRQPFDIDASLIFNFASPASPPDYQRDPVSGLLAGKEKAEVV